MKTDPYEKKKNTQIVQYSHCGGSDIETTTLYSEESERFYMENNGFSSLSFSDLSSKLITSLEISNFV
jgi:hypothetical protein